MATLLIKTPSCGLERIMQIMLFLISYKFEKVYALLCNFFLILNIPGILNPPER